MSDVEQSFASLLQIWFWMFKFWKHIVMAEDYCCPNPSSESLKVCALCFSSWKSMRPRSCWTTTHSGIFPTQRRRMRSRRTVTALRRVKTTMRTTTECWHMHTHAHTHMLNLHLPPNGLAAYPLLTPQQHSRATTEEQQHLAHRTQTQTTTGDSLYTQSAHLLPFFLTVARTVTPAPPLPLFYRDLFTFRCQRKGNMWILTQARVWMGVYVRVCVYMLCVCNLVCVCTSMRDGHTVDWRTYYLGSFLEGEMGCITANSVCKCNKNTWPPYGNHHIALDPNF